MITSKTQGGFLTSQIKNLSGRIWERLLKDSGVDVFNGAQGRILYVLWDNEQLTISEIGRLTSLAKTTLTSMLDRMEASGLIKRTPDKNNRRQIFVAVTDKTTEYRQKYDQVSEEMNKIFYKGFTEKEVADLDAMLQRILKNLEDEGV